MMSNLCQEKAYFLIMLPHSTNSYCSKKETQQKQRPCLLIAGYLINRIMPSLLKGNSSEVPYLLQDLQ